mmetsp:Transcript_12842/g.19903  ORF Transcript_12842/g.19903 Transcript_12842/m.19903 type:complete len:475 (-) Transcript_12842:91-1515(-)
MKFLDITLSVVLLLLIASSEAVSLRSNGSKHGLMQAKDENTVTPANAGSSIRILQDSDEDSDEDSDNEIDDGDEDDNEESDEDSDEDDAEDNDISESDDGDNSNIDIEDEDDKDSEESDEDDDESDEDDEESEEDDEESDEDTDSPAESPVDPTPTEAPIDPTAAPFRPTKPPVIPSTPSEVDDGGTIEIGIDDGQVTIPGGTIGPDDIVVDIPDLPGFCFSGSSTVEVKNKGYVKMMDLSLGHMVKVDENNKFEPIYSFGHKDHDGSAKYLQITTSQTKKPLEISADHMVTIEGGRYVPASSIKVGDRLVTATDDQLASVTNIKGVVRKGVFAPFTQSGTIVVNDVVASNYITFQDSEYLKIGSVQIPFTYHWLSHAFNSIHRLVVQMVGITQETYTEEGISHWAGMPHKVFSWLLHQNSFIFGASVSLALPIITMVWCFEWMLLNPLMIVTVAAGGMILLCQNNAKATKKFF